jgi:hypothetical protein
MRLSKYTNQELATMFKEIILDTHESHPIQVINLAKLSGPVMDLGKLDEGTFTRLELNCKYREIGSPTRVIVWDSSHLDTLLAMHPQVQARYTDAGWDEYWELADVYFDGRHPMLVATKEDVLVLAGYDV